jgi:hypothetical protein
VKIRINTGSLTISPPNELSPADLTKWHEKEEERKYQANLERQRALLEPASLNPKAAKAIELLRDSANTAIPF